MDEVSSKGILAKIGLAILVIALLDLFFLNWWVLRNEKLNRNPPAGGEKVADDRQLTKEVESSQPLPVDSPSPSPMQTAVGSENKSVAETVNQSGSAKTLTVIQTGQKEIFIPVGSGSIKKRDWTDIPGLEVTIDTSKYPGIDSIVFEATIWPEGGNGSAYARINNISDSNPLIESQISNTSINGQLKTSGNIPLPTGSKKYGVQAKTDIENFPAHVENARIKITLK